MSEADFLQYIQQQFADNKAQHVLVPAGVDDCGIVSCNGLRELAISCDAFVDNIHFTSHNTSIYDIGAKAIRASLSDLAASACQPLWALVTAGLPANFGEQNAETLLSSLCDTLAQYNAVLIGGDTVAAPVLTLSVTVIGSPIKDKLPDSPVSAVIRSGGEAGDILLVTGSLGGSILGRHLCPQPRFPEITALVKLADINAAMDISDGLVLDTSRLCQASGCDACLWLDKVPIHADAHKLAGQQGYNQKNMSDAEQSSFPDWQNKSSPLSHALYDGEDFELLVAIPESQLESILIKWQQLITESKANKNAKNLTELTAIGQLIATNTAGGTVFAAPQCTQKDWIKLAHNGYIHDF